MTLQKVLQILQNLFFCFYFFSLLLHNYKSQLKIMSNLFLTNEKNPFVGFTTKWIENYINTVNKLIMINSKDYHAPVLKNGKKPIIYKIPYMIPIWEKGLQIAKKELYNRKNNSK
jgi:hypothetical protein